MKPLVVRQPLPELTPLKLHLKDNASDEDYGDDGVYDHTQNCEMSDFHMDIEENVEEQIGPISS